MWCYPHPLLWTSSHSKEGEGGKGEVKWEEEVKGEEEGKGGMYYLHLLVVDVRRRREWGRRREGRGGRSK